MLIWAPSYIITLKLYFMGPVQGRCFASKGDLLKWERVFTLIERTWALADCFISIFYVKKPYS